MLTKRKTVKEKTPKQPRESAYGTSATGVGRMKCQQNGEIK